MQPKSLFEKIWDRHVVIPETVETPGVLYIDLHLVHEVTSPQAFSTLRDKGLKARRPDRTFATMDHSIPSLPYQQGMGYPFVDDQAKAQVQMLIDNCQDHRIPLFKMGEPNQGIVHVVGPELGLTTPGKTIVCGDSHTSTHGAFGCLAFGIGTSEVAQVLATQCMLQRKPKSMAVNFEGSLPHGTSAKDLILFLISKIGIGGGTGHVLEYRGKALKTLDMEQRMTVCNMSIEAGARAGMIAPDEITFNYLYGKPYAPSGQEWDRALENWNALQSDQEACYDHMVHLDVSNLGPMVTWGTNPEMAVGIQEPIPMPTTLTERKALEYMGLEAGKPLEGQPVDVVFIGSCTNSRISDLREAASIMKDQKIANGMRVLVVPGSSSVKKQAEQEGLDQIFLEAGAEWREPSCSMCIAMNGDHLEPGQWAVSTSNRNFEGRQGKGGRTILASPATAAASALKGCLTDFRKLVEVGNGYI